MPTVDTGTPGIPVDVIRDFCHRVYGIEVKALRDLGSYIDQNILITDATDSEFLFKVHSAHEHEAVLDFQNKTMEHLADTVTGVAFPQPLLSLSGEEISELETDNGLKHYIRILTFLPGVLLKEVAPIPSELLADVGRVVGEMDAALETFYHPASNRPDIPWDLKNASHTGNLSRFIEDPGKRRIAEYFFLKFDNEVAPILAGLRKTVVHGDSHRYSILLDEQCSRVSGIIDFGDAVYTHTICNLAVCLSDMMVHQAEPVADAAIVIAAYHRAFPLSEDELEILFYLVCTRLSIYVSMAAYSRRTDPENAHAQSKEADIWALMDKLVEVNPLYTLAHFRETCGFPSRDSSVFEAEEANLQDRENLFASSLYTHYREPLHLVGGALQYLHDDRGRSYLDCVNNVCQWGHCHPSIVRAGQKQMARLNTNSRYVYEVMTAYADSLLSTFPDPLNVCFLVNSGSEANDLALRLARTYTGNEDVIVIDKAYHGNSTVCTEISPHRVDRPGLPGLGGYVHKCLIPDTFRGQFGQDDPEAGQKYAGHVKTLINEICSSGSAVAAFIAESLIGTGGQVVLPENYLKSVYSHVRDSGGICIADEVQMGFGRVGTHTWCFETQDVVPDIVTMGKPIGNGHPMAAVVTTREIADAYDRSGVTYFNTFGGNPVSCAIGQAVLDVMERENLKSNVCEMSSLLFDGLKVLRDRYPVIADVRGQGLYIGMELVEDRTSLKPASRLAGNVVEEMKSRGILLNTNGYDNNIIKIKPPLIIGEKDVKRLLAEFDGVLSMVL